MYLDHQKKSVSARLISHGHLFNPLRLKFGCLALLLGIALAVFDVPTAAAQPVLKDIRSDATSNYFAPPPGITLKQATAIARKHTGGRVLSADPRQRGTIMEYRVRLLIDGERVITLMVDEKGKVRNRR